MLNEKIIEQFEKDKLRYESLKDKCKTLISDLLSKQNIKFHKIESRIKEKESLIKKVESESKMEKYHCLDDITDIFGIRIITYFEDDVDKVAELLAKEFKFDPINSVDKRWGNNPNVFGYASLHQVLSISDSRIVFPEYEHLKDLKFEVQIRSILQHAWAEIEHDIGYKNKSSISIPVHLTRSFSRIAGLLELADLEFKRIRDELEVYTEEVKNRILNEKYDLLIDNVTFKEFLLKSEIAKKVDLNLLHLLNPKSNLLFEDTPLEQTLDKLSFLKVETISQLDDYLTEKENQIVTFADAWFDKRGLKKEFQNITGCPIGISTFYLSLVMVAEKNDESLITEFVKRFVETEDVLQVSTDILETYNTYVKIYC